MGFFSKIRKVAAKFDLGHQYGKKMGLPDPSGDLLYGSDRALSPAELAQKTANENARLQADAQNQAAEQASLARQQQESQAQAMALMQSNFQTDLKGENLNSVVAGGTADATAAAVDPLKRKRASGLSSTLGIG